MPSDLDALLEFLETSGVQTSQGSYVSTDNLRKWVEQRQGEALRDAVATPRPRTMVQAKRMAARDEEIFPKSTDPFGAQKVIPSVNSGEPQLTTPVSEDVNP